ncbi:MULTISPECIES: hypothetical protein [Eikenella]|uniref:hypothetical protein n=1 Tax=Eikenella TaxID=538 RepID=UPI0018D429ED|nr:MULTISPECIES: hypothetical protein [Eikenella]
MPFAHPPLCLSLLQEAFTASSAPFNEQWLLIRQMPDEQLKTSDPWQYSCAVIIFQVAELHRMRGQELQNELRHYGITSETGYSRYNSDPLTLLEYGAQGAGRQFGGGRQRWQRIGRCWAICWTWGVITNK